MSPHQLSPSLPHLTHSPAGDQANNGGSGNSESNYSILRGLRLRAEIGDNNAVFHLLHGSWFRLCDQATKPPSISQSVSQLPIGRPIHLARLLRRPPLKLPSLQTFHQSKSPKWVTKGYSLKPRPCIDQTSCHVVHPHAAQRSQTATRSPHLTSLHNGFAQTTGNFEITVNGKLVHSKKTQGTAQR